jgi:hypothetical protein
MQLDSFDPNRFIAPTMLRLVLHRLAYQHVRVERTTSTQRTRLNTTLEPAPFENQMFLPANWLMPLPAEVEHVAQMLCEEINERRKGRIINLVNLGFELMINPETFDPAVFFFIEWNVEA